MNKLTYGLLSLLSTEPMTGYDLTMRINRFWRSTHSAIYPLLSELEEKGFIELTIRKQSGKPDKKIYNLTAQGRELLYDWFTSETSDAVTRDEMMLKLYCIKCMDNDAAEKILNELEERYKLKIEEFTNSKEKIKIKPSENCEVSVASLFGAYILIEKGLNEAKLNLKWCKWVRKLYESNDFSFLNEDFN